MDIILRSWSVLVKQGDGILGILCIFLLGGGIAFLYLKTLFEDRLTFGEYFALSVGGALFPLFLGISLTLLLHFFFAVKINLILCCLAIFIIGCFAFFRLKQGQYQKPASRYFSPIPEQCKNAGFRRFFPILFTQHPGVVSTLILILILIVSAYIRLAFISGLIAPLYFDSAIHYSIITGLITRFETSTLATFDSLVEGYYHLGFHALISAISLALHQDVKDVMLIFGQIILAILPLPLFFIVRQETKLDAPAIFAALLAGWGWSMPAFAINWGKYPALTSILAFELVLCSLYLLQHSPKGYRWHMTGVLGFCVLVSTFIHSRSLVLIILAIISSALSLVWRRLSRLARNIILCLIGGGLLTLIFIVQSKPILTVAFNPYRGGGLWMILLILLLLPLALKEFPTITFSVILSLLFLLGSLFVPVIRLLPGYDFQTLLDRPFVEMFLFFPLAFLGGLGYAGLVRTLKNLKIFRGSHKIWMNLLLIFLFFGAFSLNITQYDFSPSACCQFFGEDDAVALEWMDRHIPLDAKIFIASFESSVLESATAPSYNSADGGAWISPLIHRNSALMAEPVDFGAQKTLDELCKDKITHIYVGGKERSFDLTQLQNQPAWYEMLLLLPKAQVFKIIGCQ